MKAIYPPNDHTHSWLNCQKLFQWHPLIPQQEISFYTPAAAAFKNQTIRYCYNRP